MKTEKIKILFVCTVNRMRSATAHKMFENDQRFEVDSAGTDKTATTVLEPEHLEWADAVIVMEKYHRSIVRHKYPEYYSTKKIVAFIFLMIFILCNLN